MPSHCRIVCLPVLLFWLATSSLPLEPLRADNLLHSSLLLRLGFTASLQTIAILVARDLDPRRPVALRGLASTRQRFFDTPNFFSLKTLCFTDKFGGAFDGSLF